MLFLEYWRAEGMEVGERQLRLSPASADWDFSVTEGDPPCVAHSEGWCSGFRTVRYQRRF
jgi:hypothetical protein